MQIELSEVLQIVGTLYIENMQLRSENVQLGLELAATQEKGAKLERMVGLEPSGDAMEKAEQAQPGENTKGIEEKRGMSKFSEIIARIDD